jgi:malate dehydrogenase (oxaloacetate-decarboxylating)
MISAASQALADNLTKTELESRCLMPEVMRLWDVCGAVALAVARQAVADGAAPAASEDELAHRIAASRWRPAYPEFIDS